MKKQKVAIKDLKARKNAKGGSVVAKSLELERAAEAKESIPLASVPTGPDSGPGALRKNAKNSFTLPGLGKLVLVNR